MSETYAEQVASVHAHGWTTFLCTEEDKQGRELRMPQWVMDHACRNVDACEAAAVRAEHGGGFRIVCAYLSEELDGDVYDHVEDAQDIADLWNDDHGVEPLVVPRGWAVVG